MLWSAYIHIVRTFTQTTQNGPHCITGEMNCVEAGVHERIEPLLWATSIPVLFQVCCRSGLTGVSARPGTACDWVLPGVPWRIRWAVLREIQPKRRDLRRGSLGRNTSRLSGFLLSNDVHCCTPSRQGVGNLKLIRDMHCSSSISRIDTLNDRPTIASCRFTFCLTRLTLWEWASRGQISGWLVLSRMRSIGIRSSGFRLFSVQ